MNSDFEQCYQALKSRDRRFDGRFFVAVSSTGIYCRPVCPARLPKPENCSFFNTFAAAELEGYRPCKRCRPELAPGLSCIDMPDTLLSQACRFINHGFLDQHSVVELAERIGITDRHLRRLFQTELGASPLELANSQRLLQARQLLRDTRLPVTDIAHLCGFNSIRSFNHQFRQTHKQSPSEIRKQKQESSTDPITLKLGYRPPFNWKHLLDTPFDGLTHTFPDAQTIASLQQEQLGKLGIVRQRSHAIFAVAQAVANEELNLSPLANVAETIDKLISLKGIGPWTAQYITMRALSWPDAFPDQDLGIIKALGTKHRKTILQTAEQWRPWRAYAVMHLWDSLIAAKPLPDIELKEAATA